MIEYHPQPGFFDITNKPQTLDSKSHKKLQAAQMELARIQQQADYYRKFHPQQWEKAKDLSGQVQQVIFQHWTDEELFGV